MATSARALRKDHPPVKNVPSRERPAAPVVPIASSEKALVRPSYQEFARKLREAMASRQMSASDVARAIWGTAPDPRGYPVARNRDRIGAYLAGTGYPSKETMPKLCAAVGLSMDDLPEPTRSTAARGAPNAPADLSFNLLQDHPDLCSFYIRTILSVETGLKIIDLVKKDREARISDEAADAD